MTSDEQREIVTLREYMDHRVEALDKRIDERFIALTNVLTLQAKEYERRLDDMNHLQKIMQDERSHFMPRELSEQRGNLIAERVSLNSSRLDKIEGKSSGMAMFWGILVAVAMLVLGVIGFLVKK